MITGRQLIDSYYEEDEKLFSTGNDELDDILEEVYYSGIEDGYDYAQREFAYASEDIKDYRSRKGAGKSLMIGGVNSAIGRKAGIRESERASRQGRSYEEQEKIGGKRAARVAGGLTAASYGAAGLAAGTAALAAKAKNPQKYAQMLNKAKGALRTTKGKAGVAGAVLGVGAHIAASAAVAKKGAKESIRDAQLNKYRAEERTGKVK